jgi:hypothetical protein
MRRAGTALALLGDMMDLAMVLTVVLAFSACMAVTRLLDRS